MRSLEQSGRSSETKDRKKKVMDQPTHGQFDKGGCRSSQHVTKKVKLYIEIDGPTDGQTDKAGCKVTCTQLKR